jgi:hypothetical protein
MAWWLYKIVCICRVYVAELSGVFEGLKYARRLGYNIVELNFLRLRKLLTGCSRQAYWDSHLCGIFLVNLLDLN